MRINKKKNDAIKLKSRLVFIVEKKLSRNLLSFLNANQKCKMTFRSNYFNNKNISIKEKIRIVRSTHQSIRSEIRMAVFLVLRYILILYLCVHCYLYTFEETNSKKTIVICSTQK